MKNFFLFTVVLLISISCSVSQPKFTISLSGGYNLPLPDMKGSVSSETDRSNTYLIKNGYNIGLAGKYGIGKKRMLRIVIGGSYNKFSGEGSYFHENNVDIHSHFNIITTGLGIEYAILPKDKINPFLGLDLTGNFLSGEKVVTVTAPGPNLDHDELGTETLKMTPASRFGLAISGGVDISLNRSIGILIGFKYNMANLIGKDHSSSAAVGEFMLNDKAEGTNVSKNISFIQLNAGISFYLGMAVKKTGK